MTCVTVWSILAAPHHTATSRAQLSWASRRMTTRTNTDAASRASGRWARTCGLSFNRMPHPDCEDTRSAGPYDRMALYHEFRALPLCTSPLRGKMKEAADDVMNRLMQECSRNCLETYAACTAAATHCLQYGHDHAGREYQTTLLDCARLCATAAEFLLRGSPMHESVCGVCATSCRICEQHCRSLSEPDAMMQRCVEMCARTAESCERMSGDYR